MTAGSMRVDPHELRRVEPAFAALALSVDETLRRLASVLDAEGECWGRDRTGSAFAESYVPAATQTRQALPDLRDGVRGVGDALLLVADNVDVAESRAQVRFS